MMAPVIVAPICLPAFAGVMAVTGPSMVPVGTSWISGASADVRTVLCSLQMICVPGDGRGDRAQAFALEARQKG